MLPLVIAVVVTLVAFLTSCTRESLPVPAETGGPGLPSVGTEERGGVSSANAALPEQGVKGTSQATSGSVASKSSGSFLAPTEVEQDGPSIHRRDSYAFHKLRGGLETLAARYETQPGPDSSAASASRSSVAYVPVRPSIFQVGDPAPTIQWLEENGVVAAGVGEGTFCIPHDFSYCPPQEYLDGIRINVSLLISLLAPLSVRPEVLLIDRWSEFDNMTPSLRHALVEYKAGLRRLASRGAKARLNRDRIAVKICWILEDQGRDELDRMEVFSDWLKANGASSHSLYPFEVEASDFPEGILAPGMYFLLATVPLELLPGLSRRVEDIGVDRSKCTPLDMSRTPPRSTLGVWESDDFIVYSNVHRPGRLRLSLWKSELEEPRAIAIGDCEGGNTTLGVKHGDIVTFAACSPGTSEVRIYDGDKLLWQRRLSSDERSPRRPFLEWASSETPSPRGAHSSMLRIGKTLTLRLRNPASHQDRVKVSIGNHQQDLDGLNLTLDDCPGSIGDSVVLTQGIRLQSGPANLALVG